MVALLWQAAALAPGRRINATLINKNGISLVFPIPIPAAWPWELNGTSAASRNYGNISAFGRAFRRRDAGPALPAYTCGRFVVQVIEGGWSAELHTWTANLAAVHPPGFAYRWTRSR